MKLKVHMLAFAKGAIREVEVPDEAAHSVAAMLNLTYHHGQNDEQAAPLPSVSIGDVIELPNGELHEVTTLGFAKLEPGTVLKPLTAEDVVRKTLDVRRKDRHAEKDPEHGTVRNHRMESSWTGHEAIEKSTGKSLGPILGSGLTQTVSERWCAGCRSWVEVKGVMGALAFDFEHGPGKKCQETRP